ncbi:ATP-binding cassette domain-containing protein [Rhizobium rhizogenes]|uniref:ATP-binding cassette domain-containing protein n=1 Tax=Rhizobium rhizogenes TaxID=359 RepID=UPI001572B04E|nr:ATP-binding cassette domain-containing protein [Rhizobium rhizogenes]NTF98024.1 ABC transporter ATP-binding protein [Rhizobium rhizogenes]
MADLEMGHGEMLTLIDQSGGGKTTLLNLFSSLTRPTKGRINVGGASFTEPIPDKVAYVFQEHALFPRLNIKDNIRVALKFRDVVATEAEERALNAVGRAGFAGHFSRQLFGGPRQWASLARALSLGETVLLSDRIAIFSARPGRINTMIEINEPHPRRAAFATSDKFAKLRARLRDELPDKIRQSTNDLSIDTRARPEAPHDNRHLPCQAPIWRRDLAGHVHHGGAGALVCGRPVRNSP